MLWTIYYIGTWVSKFLHFPIPGSVLGMICLFTLLSTGVIKEQWLSATTNFLLKHLSFFFIPIAVELMEWGDLFIQKGYLLFLPLVVSALVALLTTGGIVQHLVKPHHVKKGVTPYAKHRNECFHYYPYSGHIFYKSKNLYKDTKCATKPFVTQHRCHHSYPALFRNHL
nr:CidA/LrgA family protein [Desulfosporosinus sp. I2]